MMLRSPITGKQTVSHHLFSKIISVTPGTILHLFCPLGIVLFSLSKLCYIVCTIAYVHINVIIEEISQVRMFNDESRNLHRLTVEVHRRVIPPTDTDKVEQISLVPIKDKGIPSQRPSVTILLQ